MGYDLAPPPPRDMAFELIVEHIHHRFGPLSVLERIAAMNPVIEIYVLKGVGHQFGQRQAQGLDYAATWLTSTLGPPRVDTQQGQNR